MHLEIEQHIINDKVLHVVCLVVVASGHFLMATQTRVMLQITIA